MEYLLNVLILASINVILASSFNLILGYGGLVSIAHPVFYAIGGYCSALIAVHLHLPVPLTIAIGGLFAALMSIGLSLPSLRVSGDYLVIASIGFQLGIIHVINNVEFTGAAGGLSSIPSLLDGSGRSMLFAVAIVLAALLTVFIIRALVNGPYGKAIAAMRDDEEAFSALGRNPVQIKVILFAIGSGMAGVAGGL
jgi:branched-chain amino acid transport system permease protein